MCSSTLKGLGFSPQTTRRCNIHEPPSTTDIGKWEVGRRQEGFDKNFLGMNYTVSFTPSGRGEGEGPSPRTEREAREVRRERHALNWTPTPGVQLGEQTHV